MSPISTDYLVLRDFLLMNSAAAVLQWTCTLPTGRGVASMPLNLKKFGYTGEKQAYLL